MYFDVVVEYKDGSTTTYAEDLPTRAMAKQKKRTVKNESNPAVDSVNVVDTL